MSVHVRKAVPSDAGAIARVHVDSWRTTYRGIIPDSYLASLSHDQRTNQWKNSLENENWFVFVAEDSVSKQIVGFASGGPDRSKDPEYTGELGAIYLLVDYQRKGIGQKLVAALVRKLIERGHASMLVWVLAENPYRRFYEEKLGGRYLRSKHVEIAGSRYEEIAYGWRNLGILLRMT